MDDLRHFVGRGGRHGRRGGEGREQLRGATGTLVDGRRFGTLGRQHHGHGELEGGAVVQRRLSRPVVVEHALLDGLCPLALARQRFPCHVCPFRKVRRSFEPHEWSFARRHYRGEERCIARPNFCNHVVDRCCCQPSLHGWFVRDERRCDGHWGVGEESYSGTVYFFATIGALLRRYAPQCATLCEALIPGADRPLGRLLLFALQKRDRCAHRFARLHLGEVRLPGRVLGKARCRRRRHLGRGRLGAALPRGGPLRRLAPAHARRRGRRGRRRRFRSQRGRLCGGGARAALPGACRCPLRPEAGRPSRHRPAHGGRLGAQERPRSRGGGERSGAAAPVAAGGGERRAADRACGRRGA